MFFFFQQFSTKIITHGFGNRAHDLVGLFNRTNKISTFMNKLEKQSLIDPLRYDSNKYKGDGFEFLVEIFLKSHSYDNRIGITNYEPVQKDDNGVDGVGINLSGEKYGVSADMEKLKLIADGKLAPLHYVITTASGLHHYTDNQNFGGYVHCIGYEQLRSMLDNNLSFWNLCREITDNVQKSKIK